ncbi:hypothetical protein RSSM_04376 [Rhodopirellula sallentina SM41]|uniref:Uncharacterized protein n=1 Tax=Rhodopirellula sallentina SM41 TaxID=1263870 RepID=M5U8I9_9BACT|nr:hypothetical protein RSSM_04376 [Rhodopirellula sallentina SM41]
MHRPPHTRILARRVGTQRRFNGERSESAAWQRAVLRFERIRGVVENPRGRQNF